MFSQGGFFDLTDERSILRMSVGMTVLVASLGIGFGLVSGSFAIMFDGIYSLLDASMSLLSLVVVNLIMAYSASSRLPERLRVRFSMGFWHLEPIVLALNGILLISVAAYALVNAISSLLEGGRSLEFGYAIAYAAVTVVGCATIAIVEHRANRTIGSDFLALDVKGWIMSGGITAALLVAFCIGYLVQGTTWQWISPYIDPAVLAIVCVIIIPLPVATVRRALGQVFLITPLDLRAHVDQVAQAFVEKHGLMTYRAYVAQVGRLAQVELYLLVPPEMPAKTIAEWDALRDEMGEAIGGEGHDRWLTVVFTGDKGWAE